MFPHMVVLCSHQYFWVCNRQSAWCSTVLTLKFKNKFPQVSWSCLKKCPSQWHFIYFSHMQWFYKLQNFLLGVHVYEALSYFNFVICVLMKLYQSCLGVVDICLHGAFWSTTKLAPWDAWYPASGSDVESVEGGWHWIPVLGYQLLWEGYDPKCWGMLCH
jgi:hypothetical protein